MSYILDALRKSESERRQGKVPELGHQVQLIHKPKKASAPVLVWLGIALLMNAAVLAYVFWPQTGGALNSRQDINRVEGAAEAQTPDKNEAVSSKSNAEEKAAANAHTAAPTQEARSSAQVKPRSTDTVPETQPAEVEPEKTAETPEAPAENQQETKPTIIVPSNRPSGAFSGTGSTSDPASFRHLVEMPLAYQKSIPDLVFNSHIYASDPSARRVMINGHYLSIGESFSGIRVEQITEEGVVLRKDGQSFRVGSVRNWVSPD